MSEKMKWNQSKETQTYLIFKMQTKISASGKLSKVMGMFHILTVVYMGACIYQTSSKCKLKICAFYCVKPYFIKLI